MDIRKYETESSRVKPVVKVGKKKLSREPGASVFTQSGEEVVTTGGCALGESCDHRSTRDHIYMNNYDYADFYTVKPEVVGARSVKTSDRKPPTRDGVYSTESDSGLDVTPETTPYTSRPESELLINDDKDKDDEAEDVEASPRQLEIMMEESKRRRRDPTQR